MKNSRSGTARLAVTTAVNDTDELIEKAQALAAQLNAVYLPRDNLPIHYLFEISNVERMLIVRHDRFVLQNSAGDEYQFHPNLAIVRAANYAKHRADHFLEAVDLTAGEQVLDCTIGFGSEALLAAMAVGSEGEVVGLESVPELAIITREGMQKYVLQQKKLESVMRQVVVLNFDYRNYLKLAPTRLVDVVYFDPFFEQPLERSLNSIAPLAMFGDRAPLDNVSVTEARRVARRIVVIKHLRWQRLSADIERQVSNVVCGRRSLVAYSIIPSFGASAYRHYSATGDLATDD